MNIQTVKMKYERQLMQLPNVTGVAIGQKGGKEVIKVFVREKVSESALLRQEIIPKMLEGYEVDVEEIGHVTPQGNPSEK